MTRERDRDAASLYPCVTCGYDLRGLPEDGVCPECGTPVARSLAGDRLEHADPRWLATVVRGQTLVSWGLTSAIGFWIVMIIAAITVGIVDVMVVADLSAITEIALEIGSALFIGGGLLVATVGVFLLTSQEPRESLREPSTAPRIIARLGLLATLVLSAAAWASSYGTFGLPVVIVESGLLLIFAIALAAAVSGLLRHQADLASRLPDEGMAAASRRNARRFAWLLPAAAVAAVATRHLPSVFVATNASRPLTSAVAGIVTVTNVVLWFWLLGQSIAILTLMGRLRRALRVVGS